MLGTSVIPPVVEAVKPTPQVTMEMPPQVMPQPTIMPVMPPMFTIPTPTTQVPVQAVPKITIPQKKNAGVKALMFVVLFVALGFTTFFILKTMYPIEFGNIFGGGQTQMHASEAVTGTEITGTGITGTEITGTETPIEQTSGIIDTGTGAHESAGTT